MEYSERCKPWCLRAYGGKKEEITEAQRNEFSFPQRCVSAICYVCCGRYLTRAVLPLVRVEVSGAHVVGIEVLLAITQRIQHLFPLTSHLSVSPHTQFPTATFISHVDSHIPLPLTQQFLPALETCNALFNSAFVLFLSIYTSLPASLTSSSMSRVTYNTQ